MPDFRCSLPNYLSIHLPQQLLQLIPNLPPMPDHLLFLLLFEQLQQLLNRILFTRNFLLIILQHRIFPKCKQRVPTVQFNLLNLQHPGDLRHLFATIRLL